MSDDPALILARHVRNTRFEQLADDVVLAAKRDILDTLGVAIAGSSAPGVGELVKLARKWGGLEESSLLVLGGQGTGASSGNGQRSHGPRSGLRRYI